MLSEASIVMSKRLKLVGKTKKYYHQATRDEVALILML